MVEGMDITDRQLTGIARAVHLTVNDREYTLEIDPRESLLDILRARLDLTGTKSTFSASKALASRPRQACARDRERRPARRRTADPRPPDPPPRCSFKPDLAPTRQPCPFSD
jgi:hypothetical protein